MTVNTKGKSMSNTETPKILWPALRQYRHNNGSDDFVAAFDYEKTVEVVEQLMSGTPYKAEIGINEILAWAIRNAPGLNNKGNEH